jgi:hypothetical protein
MNKFDDLLGDSMPDDLYAKMPEGITRHEFMKLIRSTAISMSDYGDFLSKSNDDLVTMIDEIADPDRDYPYTHQKWEMVNDLSLWSCNDLEPLATELIDNKIDSGFPRNDYLFPVLDAYISSAIYMAIHIVMDYVGAKCLFCDGEITGAHMWRAIPSEYYTEGAGA